MDSATLVGVTTHIPHWSLNISNLVHWPVSTQAPGPAPMPGRCPGKHALASRSGWLGGWRPCGSYTGMLSYWDTLTSTLSLGKASAGRHLRFKHVLASRIRHSQ